MLDTKIGTKGMGNYVMSKGFAKVGSNGSNGNGSVAVAEIVASNGASAVVVEEAVAEVVVEKVEAVEEVVEIKPLHKVAPVVTLERKME